MRALVIVLDSVGVGNAPDAAEYGDEGANTLGHIFENAPGLNLPWLHSLGLGPVLGGNAPPSISPNCCYGRMREKAPGKDTVSGHWEIAGVILDEPFAVFERFPDHLVSAIEEAAGVTFIGNRATSGTVILEELGPEHLEKKNPILYTSADSVMQIAAHEDVIPLTRLYDICRHARNAATPHRIGRVIARPFKGSPGTFQRTENRHDFTMVPPRTILNALGEAGFEVHGVGKISDIFARSGLTQDHHTADNADGMATIEHVWPHLKTGLVFVNLVDFDALYGHRRDVAGYAAALAAFDEWLGKFLPEIYEDDLLIITADHGNDPTFRGTDHTREEVPLLVKYDSRSGDLGTRDSFTDVAATLASFFQLSEPWPIGKPFLKFPSAHARSFGY